MLRRCGAVFFSVVLLTGSVAWGQSVFDVLPSTPSGSFTNHVTLPDASSWGTTGLTFSPGTSLRFPDLSTWSSTGPTLTSNTTLQLPDGSTWTRAALQFNATATLRGPDGATWTSTGFSVGTGKQFYLANGTSSAPALSFGAQATAGWYRQAADDLRLVSSGSLLLRAYKSGATGLLSIPLGSSTGSSLLGGRLCTSTTSAATTGTTSQTLASCLLPANALSIDGMGIRIKAWGITAANANSKTFELYFGATACATLTGTINNGALVAETTVLRTGASTQECGGTVIGGTSVAATRQTPSETLSGAVTVAAKATTPTAAGDVTFKGWTVEVIN